MSINMFRHEVLQSFKRLHQVRKNVFKDDHFALEAARKKINEEFKSKKHVKEESAINELVHHANDVAQEMKSTIVQAREVKPGTYELRITPETAKLVNVPFKDCPS